MIFSPEQRDNQPVAWMRNVPIYATTWLAALMLLGMIATALLESARVPLASLQLDPRAFFHGALWQPFSAPLLNEPNFFFLFCLFFFYAAGVEVEKFIGRRRYFLLIAILLALPVAVLGGWRLATGEIAAYDSSYLLTAALFIAFSTLYPNVSWFGFIPLKWIAAACLLLMTMQFLPAHDWVELSLCWVMCAAAFGYIRALQFGVRWNPLAAVRNVFRPRPKFHVVSRPRTVAARPKNPNTTTQSMDALLDKISRSGLKSLTREERATLERIRKKLCSRDAGR